jgi:hypothetical protein
VSRANSDTHAFSLPLASGGSVDTVRIDDNEPAGFLR